jgi:cell division protein FtsB
MGVEYAPQHQLGAGVDDLEGHEVESGAGGFRVPSAKPASPPERCVWRGTTRCSAFAWETTPPTAQVPGTSRKRPRQNVISPHRHLVLTPAMKVDLGIWDKLAKLVLFLIVLAAVLAVAVWYLPLIQRNERMRREILLLEGKIEQERQLNRQLKADHEAQKDPRTVERLAREKLNLAKPGETVIRFQPAATNLPAAGSR